MLRILEQPDLPSLPSSASTNPSGIIELNMDFDEKAFLDILRLLQEKPELREALRQVLLTKAILNLPAQMEELIQTVREGQIQIQQLTQIVREG